MGFLHEEEQNVWIQERLAVSGPYAASTGPQPGHLSGLCALTDLRATDREKEVRREQDTLYKR